MTPSDRVRNFLDNWLDANIIHPAEVPQSDPDARGRQFLTDAVAAGLTLDDVNEEWPAIVDAIINSLLDKTDGANSASAV